MAISKWQKEELKKMNENRCQFGDCILPAVSIVRQKYLCSKHCKIIRKDNKERFLQNQDIPKDLNILDSTRECFVFDDE